jgi:hypothetical protein
VTIWPIRNETQIHAATAWIVPQFDNYDSSKKTEIYREGAKDAKKIKVWLKNAQNIV